MTLQDIEMARIQAKDVILPAIHAVLSPPVGPEDEAEFRSKVASELASLIDDNGLECLIEVLNEALCLREDGVGSQGIVTGEMPNNVQLAIEKTFAEYNLCKRYCVIKGDDEHYAYHEVLTEENGDYQVTKIGVYNPYFVGSNEVFLITSHQRLAVIKWGIGYWSGIVNLSAVSTVDLAQWKKVIYPYINGYLPAERCNIKWLPEDKEDFKLDASQGLRVDQDFGYHT